jgi:hypothetical protein
MSATATIPFVSPRTANTPWMPTDRDRLIFQWVKFDGHKQSWVASQLGIHQTTVSRIVDHYERWIARGGPSQQGALSHDERLRSQRWLAYERNEWILSSALRIAGEMERAIDSSKSTITRPLAHPSQESEVRTEHKVLDRSGIAARFLRLAHRINMDQLKLVEQEPLPALEPLSIEDLGENDFPALAETPDAECHGHSARADRAGAECPAAAPSDLPSQSAEPHELATDSRPLAPDSRPLTPAPSPDSPAPVSIIELSPSASPVHTTHQPTRGESTITPNHTTTSAKSRPPKKTSDPAYAVASSPPELTAPLPAANDRPSVPNPDPRAPSLKSSRP